MSEQSPWGSPPPSNPPSGPPGYQPGGAGGWSGGPPSYGVPYGQGGPPGPPPRKKPVALVLGIVAAVVLVVAAFVVTLVVTSGDDEPDQASTSDTATDPTSDATSDGTSDPTSDPTTDPTSDATESDPPPADGDTISGDGYTYSLPNVGWKDVTTEAESLNAPTIDTVIVLGSSMDLSQSNIIVEALSAGTASEPEDLANLWKRNLASDDSPKITDTDDISIDGRVNAADVPITQIAYLGLHEGNQYAITLSFPRDGDDVSEGDLKTMIDSWRWTS